MLKLGVYQHYKGKYYQVLGVGRHSENLEILVVYQELSGNYALWIRPLVMFIEAVILDEQLVPRFAYVGENLTIPPQI